MKKVVFYGFSILLVFAISSCNAGNSPKASHSMDKNKGSDQIKKGESVAYFAEGCFWCVEEVFESLVGVREAISGYSGGKELNPTYEMVSAGRTSHAEAVMIIYDSTKIDYPTLVRAFFASHDATTLNRQGPDTGAQYRSIAFYSNDKEKTIIEMELKKEQSKLKKTIVTQVMEFKKFYKAEDYHQDYIIHNPNNPYVQSVSIPRFNKFKSSFKEGNFKK